MTKSIWGDLFFLITCFVTIDIFNNYIVEEQPLPFLELFSLKNLVSMMVGVSIGLIIGHYFRKNRIQKELDKKQ